MKIHTYGCSFTNYGKWPTYADILGLQYDVKNRGASGSGNERIFYYFMEDYRSNKISSEDIVIMQWSGLTRFDYLNGPDNWYSVGNVLNEHDREGLFVYSKIKDWYNPDYEFEKTVNYKICFESIAQNLGCKILQMSLSPIKDHDKNFLENNLWDNYAGSYKFYYQPWVRKNKKNAAVDEHPTVMQHYNLAKKVAENLNLKLEIDKQKIQKLHDLILSKKDFRLKYYFDSI